MRGSSLVEVVVSLAIMLAVVGSVLAFVRSGRLAFETDLERADMQQRMRVSMDALFRDLVMAGAGLQIPAIAPFRRGDVNPDVPGAAFVNRLSLRYVPPDATAAEAVTITYALRADAAGAMQLTRYDGRTTELPIVDQVADLAFEYFDASGQQMAIGGFTDGPWVPDAVAVDRFDADLQAIRRVRARVRVRPARMFAGRPLTDFDLGIDVTPRNVNLQ